MTARLIQSALVTLIAAGLAIFVGVTATRFINHAFAATSHALEQVK